MIFEFRNIYNDEVHLHGNLFTYDAQQKIRNHLQFDSWKFSFPQHEFNDSEYMRSLGANGMK